MSRKKKLQSFESVRREIARRLKAGLPLAGMIAATTLFCGCNELPGGKPVGIAPRDASACEQSPGPKPKTPAPPKKNDNREQFTGRTQGMVPREEPNATNETVDPASTRGRFPAKKKDK